jgi:hypothetical protein
VFSFIGIDQVEIGRAVRTALNEAYFESWGADARADWFDRLFIAVRYRSLLRRFGYTLQTPVPDGRVAREVAGYLYDSR